MSLPMAWSWLGEFPHIFWKFFHGLLILYSSVVLWVSQNMEDEYSYNLAL
jgi:hypothetical protein